MDQHEERALAEKAGEQKEERQSLQEMEEDAVYQLLGAPMPDKWTLGTNAISHGEVELYAYEGRCAPTAYRVPSPSNLSSLSLSLSYSSQFIESRVISTSAIVRKPGSHSDSIHHPNRVFSLPFV